MYLHPEVAEQYPQMVGLANSELSGLEAENPGSQALRLELKRALSTISLAMKQHAI